MSQAVTAVGKAPSVSVVAVADRTASVSVVAVADRYHFFDNRK
jgi:hypothetical protein